MKERLQGMITGALAVTVFLGLSAFAQDATQKITAVYRNIQLVVDGELIEPKDASGNSVEPFICNGTTYLPVRAVAAAFDKDVYWDSENAIVYIGKSDGKIAKELPLWSRSYINTSNTAQLTLKEKNGTGYISYKPIYNKSDVEDLGGGLHRVKEDLSYAVNSLATSLKGTLYMINTTPQNNTAAATEGVLKIYGDNNKLLYESPIMRISTAPLSIDVNIKNQNTVKLVFQCTYASYPNSELILENPFIVSSDY